ncbi:sensor histidine kinase [Algoriphagus winogradskyi]|uniref:Signal transduction histidine kinase internal region domain-containing protein n=1 Tax=Algoriphagus winogradskyi TaxID=237017 RepID=A0ABY1PD57_9BACT|nr:sensor histidine kinase [Algoriphagus winogradskyi]SMP31632.1 hypothetical protein SAMN06265367_107165 [Algoriphagus winogradskyi]
MKQLLHRLQLSPGFLLFIVAFAYLDSIKSRVAPGQLVNAYTFTPEAVFVAIFNIFLIVLVLRFSFKHIHGDQFPLNWKRGGLSFLTGLVLWVLLSNVVAFLFSWTFGTIDRNFLPELIISSNLNYILNFIIYGGFYFAYLLFQKYQSHQQELTAYEVAFADSTIQQLKQQLNPHFLFNNLNVLDQLIEEDPKTASRFLHDFADIYRYALDTSDRKLVTLAEEVDFAKNYFRLLSQKFGNGYQLSIALTGGEYQLPPLSLQLLVENAVLHNHARAGFSIAIQVTQTDSILTVVNTKSPYKYKKKGNGKGLDNLKKQFQLLSTQEITIEESEALFTVRLPLIKSKNI